MSNAKGPVLLYDGECGLCRAVVRLLLRLDGEGRLRYAPLQGPFAQGLSRRLGLPTGDFDSMVFIPDGEGAAHQLRTDGVLGVLRMLGRGGRIFAAIAGAVPAPWRDAAYRAVARVRHRILGKRAPGEAPDGDPRYAARFIL